MRVGHLQHTLLVLLVYLPLMLQLHRHAARMPHPQQPLKLHGNTLPTSLPSSLLLKPVGQRLLPLKKSLPTISLLTQSMLPIVGVLQRMHRLQRIVPSLNSMSKQQPWRRRRSGCNNYKHNSKPQRRRLRRVQNGWLTRRRAPLLLSEVGQQVNRRRNGCDSNSYKRCERKCARTRRTWLLWQLTKLRKLRLYLNNDSWLLTVKRS